MKKIISICKHVLAVFIFAVLIAACDTPVLNNNVQPENHSGASISISIPQIAPFLLSNGRNEDKSQSQSRSMMLAPEYEIRLFNSDDQLVRSERVDNTSLYRAKTSMDALPSGTGYYLQVNTYNPAVSQTEAILSGVSEPFDLSGREVDVVISLTPNLYNTLTSGVSQTADITGTVLNSNSSELVSMGGESWYRISTTGDTAYFMIRPDSSSCPLIALFSDSGQGVDSETLLSVYESAPFGRELFASFDVQPGENYYLGVLSCSETETINSTEITYFQENPLTADSYENNDSELNANPIALNTLIESNIHSLSDADYFIFDVEAGVSYFVDYNPSSDALSGRVTGGDTNSYQVFDYMNGIGIISDIDQTLYFLAAYGDGRRGTYSFEINEVATGSFSVRFYTEDNDFIGETLHFAIYNSGEDPETGTVLADGSLVWPVEYEYNYYSNSFHTIDLSMEIPGTDTLWESGADFYDLYIYEDNDFNNRLSIGDLYDYENILLSGDVWSFIEVSSYYMDEFISADIYENDSSAMSVGETRSYTFHNSSDIDTILLDTTIGETYNLGIKGYNSLTRIYVDGISTYIGDREVLPFTAVASQTEIQLSCYTRTGMYDVVFTNAVNDTSITLDISSAVDFNGDSVSLWAVTQGGSLETDSFASASGTISGGQLSLTAIDPGTSLPWSGNSIMDLYVLIDLDSNGEYSAGDFFYTEESYINASGALALQPQDFTELTPKDNYEPDDTSPSVITLNETQQRTLHFINNGDDVDLLRLNTVPGNSYQFDIVGEGDISSLSVNVYDSEAMNNELYLYEGWDPDLFHYRYYDFIATSNVTILSVRSYTSGRQGAYQVTAKEITEHGFDLHIEGASQYTGASVYVWQMDGRGVPFGSESVAEAEGIMERDGATLTFYDSQTGEPWNDFAVTTMYVLIDIDGNEVYSPGDYFYSALGWSDHTVYTMEIKAEELNYLYELKVGESIDLVLKEGYTVYNRPLYTMIAVEVESGITYTLGGSNIAGQSLDLNYSLLNSGFSDITYDFSTDSWTADYTGMAYIVIQVIEGRDCFLTCSLTSDQ